jgi:hypothetical protein
VNETRVSPGSRRLASSPQGIADVAAVADRERGTGAARPLADAAAALRRLLRSEPPCPLERDPRCAVNHLGLRSQVGSGALDVHGIFTVVR